MTIPTSIYSHCSAQGIGLDVWDELTAVSESDRYKIYEIRQGRSGKRRIIEEPVEPLKRIQQALITYFEKFPLHPACMARKGRNTAINAGVHEGAKHVLKVDIRKCFPSITRRLILKGVHQQLPTEIGYSLSTTLHLCMISKGGVESVLPTGAPTSPILCNIALTPLDHDLAELAEKHGYKYTRYIDDLIFSTKKEKRYWGLKNEVEAKLLAMDLAPNKKKSRWMTTGHKEKVIVTGICIGEENRLPREFRRMVRAKLNNLAVAGNPIDQETNGCLAYIKSVDPERHSSLIAFYKQRKQYASTQESNERVSTSSK